MNSVVHRIAYRAFGLHIVSEIPFPGLQTGIIDEDTPNVAIEIGDLSSLWTELSTPNVRIVANKDLVMFQMPNTATYLVRNGDQIVVSPVKGASLEKIRLYLDGYCMAALLLQRKILPLHGSAIVINKKAYAIVGSSGAGKSTLTKALLDKGYYFLSDDIIPVSLSDASHLAIVNPALPEQKLWQESLVEFGMESSYYRTIYERDIKQDEVIVEKRTKFAIPVTHFFDQPLPLAGVFEIVKTEQPEDIGISTLVKMEQLRTLINHTFHRTMVPTLGLAEWHFKTAASLVQRTEVFQIRRPSSCYTVPELVSMVIKMVEKEQGYDQHYSIGT